MLQCPSGDEEFSTKSVANMQLKQREGVLHLAYQVVFPLIIHHRPLSQRVWAEGTALGQNWRPDACDVPPFVFLGSLLGERLGGSARRLRDRGAGVSLGAGRRAAPATVMVTQTHTETKSER